MKRLIAIALALALGSALAAGGLVRGAAARAGMMADGELSAKGYVEDGLIAMWDGIENAGWGRHDSASAIWKDLVGSRDWTLGAAGSFVSNALVSAAAGTTDYAAAQDQLPKAYTIECVSVTSGGRAMFTGYGIGTGNPGVIQGLYTIAALTGFQPSFTYPTATETAWVEVDVTEVHSVTVLYTDYNEYSTTTLKSFVDAVEYTGSRTGSNYWENDGSSYIGGECSGLSQFSWSGRIYCIRMYSRNLTEREIAHNYELDRLRFNLQ